MQREVDFIYKVLRSGADYAFLRAEGAPTIRMQRSSEIKMSFQGDFRPGAVDAEGNPVPVNWLADEVEPVIVIDGVQTPLGVFAASKAPETDEDGKKTLSVQAYDRCWRVKDTRAESRPYWAAGTLYLDAVEQLLVASGVNTFVAIPTDAAFYTAREDWDVGTSYLQIINELLDEISYKPLWFDGEGVAVLEPFSVPTAESIEHTLTDLVERASGLPDPAKIERLIGRKITRSTDIYEAPNVWVCVCDNPDFPAPLVATSENNNVNSPLSTLRRGRRIVKKVDVKNIASQLELQNYADTLRNKSLISGEIIELETALLPGYGVDDVVALHYGNFDGIGIDHEWTMNLTVGGTMTHKIEKVVYNLD